MIFFWKIANKVNGIIIDNIVAAMTMPYSPEYVEFNTRMTCMTWAILELLTTVRVGHMKEFQYPMKTETPIITIGVTLIGKNTLKKILNLEQPSIIAASSKLLGIPK